jgi:DNA-binding HxlR family transcriptional regulator
MSSPTASACPIARAASLIGDEWVLIVLRELFQGAQKFDELQKKTTAATNILTQRLTRMIAAGIVVKLPYQERPPRYTYSLTKAGVALMPVTLELMRYAQEWMPSELGSPLQLRHLGCGQLTRAGQVCSECGEPLDIKSARLEARDTAAAPEPTPPAAA